MKVRHRVLLLLFLLSIITYLDRICVAVAGPRIQNDLHLSPQMWGWVLGAFTLAYSLMEVPSGAMGDRFGPRRALTRIVVWWSAFTTLTGFARGFWSLIVTRFCFGAGEAGAYPNSSASIGRWFPPSERGGAQGIVWMASRIGGALAPLLVVPIQMRYGWRASFWCFGGLGAIWAVIWYAWFRDHPSEKPEVSPEERAEIGETPANVRHTLPWRIAVRSRNFWLILAMYHTYCWGSHFYISWLHTYLEKGRGFTESQMEIFSTFPFIMGAIANGAGGFISDWLSRKYGLKFGRRVCGFTGLTLAGCFLLATALTPNRMLAVAFLALGYGSMDSMLPTAWAVCLDVGREYAGAVTGTMNMTGQLGSFLTSVTYGYMVAHFHSYNTPLIPLSAFLLVSAFLFTRIDPTERLVPEYAEQLQ